MLTRIATMAWPRRLSCCRIDVRTENRPIPRRRALMSHSRNRLDVLKVRSGQLAALAHNVVSELLPLIEIAHSGALDCGNMDEYVRSAVGRLNEAKALL